MLYTVSHITRHIYESPVSQCLNELRLTPRILPNQQVREHRIRVQPEPAVLLHGKDYFGNDVATCGVFQTHDLLVIQATSVVEVEPRAALTVVPVVLLSWEQARDLLATHADAGCLEAVEFVFDSPFAFAGAEFAEFARPTFTPGRPLLDALRELTHRIHDEFRYRPESTSIDVPLVEVLRNRRGVCQDFAHVMIAALRSLRLAARYVSGYLRGGSKYQGAQASHAWVSVFVPGTGWLDFDPTNDAVPSDGHITLAYGRDYADVTPVKGITMGGGGQRVEVEVLVRNRADT